MVSGIYTIKNKVNDKIYVGQSVDVNHRFAQHKYDLTNNCHPNSYLQRSWNKYGSDAFEFKLLKACKKQYMNRFEKLYIKKYKSSYRENGYNLDHGGDASYIKSEETRRKLSEQKMGENNPMYGIPHSTEHNMKISEKLGSTGIFRVSKKKDRCCSQGFLWTYRWMENGKSMKLSSVDLDKLKQKVLDKGLEWREFIGEADTRD